METISVIALSRADALRRQMDIVANNVANVSTTGFKSEQPLFIEYVEQASSNEKYSMVQDYTSLRNLAAGPLTQTGNQFDIALEGDGYLAVDTVDGPRYTRGGGLNLDSNRDLVNANGLPVLDDNGNAINIPSNVRQVRISPDGSVFSETGEIAKIGIVKFDNEQFMTQLGNGLYQTDQKPVAAEGTLIRQGFLEGSNVQVVSEVTRMIEINRQYQNLQNLLKTEHDRLRNAYSKLSKIA